jgi:hypothetical protein
MSAVISVICDIVPTVIDVVATHHRHRAQRRATCLFKYLKKIIENHRKSQKIKLNLQTNDTPLFLPDNPHTIQLQ